MASCRPAQSEVNQAPITGESMPVGKGPGDEVFAGTINGHGALEVRVTHLRRDTTLARIIDLVEHAQSERAPSQTFVERFARVYTPAVVSLAAAVAIVPPLVFAEPWSVWVYRALVLLVISCPCALVISTPVSIVSALAGAARKGVLIKGGRHLETLGRVRCVAFDKTGTLTHGTPEVVEVQAIAPWTRTDVLRVAASIESRSEHPIARAIRRVARDEGVDIVPGDATRRCRGVEPRRSSTGQRWSSAATACSRSAAGIRTPSPPRLAGSPAPIGPWCWWPQTAGPPASSPSPMPCARRAARRSTCCGARASLTSSC